MCFDRGTFWVLPLTYFYISKSARAYLFPQSVKIYSFCSGPISVDPICPQPGGTHRARRHLFFKLMLETLRFYTDCLSVRTLSSCQNIMLKLICLMLMLICLPVKIHYFAIIIIIILSAYFLICLFLMLMLICQNSLLTVKKKPSNRIFEIDP